MNNVVYRVAETGIHLWHDARNVIITNNTVTTSNTGIVVGGGNFYFVSGPNDHTAVYSNIVYDNKMAISTHPLEKVKVLVTDWFYMGQPGAGIEIVRIPVRPTRRSNGEQFMPQCTILKSTLKNEPLSAACRSPESSEELIS